jgi:hypothetical protein
MITPLKKSFNETLYEKNEVQKELDEIRNSAYKNFIYFPFNNKIISLINTLTSDDYS